MSESPKTPKPTTPNANTPNQTNPQGEPSMGEADVSDAVVIEHSDSVDVDVGMDKSPEIESETETETENEPTSSSKAVLAVGGGIEVNGLQSNQISVLQEQHAKGLIEVQRKASELKVDIQALDETLESLTSQARTANDAGVNITATHTQNTTLGQTEIIVGNTQRAAAGKVAPLWAGLDNNQVRTGLIIAGAVLVGVVLTSIFS